jgi:voltage-gated potassium channel
MIKSNQGCKWDDTASLRHRLHEVLEQGAVGSHVGVFVGRGLILLVVINLVTVSAESVPEVDAKYRALFLAIEMVSLFVFTLEYALRLWVAVEHEAHQHFRPGGARLRYALSAAGLIDLLSVLPFWLAFVAPSELRIVLVFRVFRFLKLTRYSPGMRSLLDVIRAERRALFGCLVIFAGATLIAAAVMHVAERGAQPDKFGTIPDAMWWAIVTLGTVGYGDVVPITPLGRIIAALTICAGFIMIALPIGIVATGFSREIHRREFVVTWSMVARVPLFADLNAGEIADIMRLLRSQTIESGGTIARRGEPAHSMYFIAAGEVEIDLPEQRLRLGAGHFFGEIAVLRRARRSANVSAIGRTNLLILDAHDFRALMARQRHLATRVRAAIRDRIGAELVTAHGDLVTEEIVDAEVEERGASVLSAGSAND